MPFLRQGSIAQGRVLNAGDLTAAPLITDVMDVKLLEVLSVGIDYVKGGASTITEIDLECQVSYDKGVTWRIIAINPDIGSPPNKGFQNGVLLRIVTGSDSWAIQDLRVGALPLFRMIATVGAGAAAAGDILSIDAYAENSAGG